MENTFTNESDSVLSETTRRTHPTPHSANNNDPGFHQVKRKKNPRGHFILEYYETPRIMDSRIRNAVTGMLYSEDHPKCKYLVGSLQEDLFFKACVSTGETELYHRDNLKNTVLLFYDSPEQFEKHQNLTLSQQVKEKWQEKNRLRRVMNRKKYLSNENAQ